jgi:hypothetical protein
MPRLRRGQLLELVVHAVELELGTDAQVLYDQKVIEPGSGVIRQIDSIIRARVSEREFVRIVEVQDRASRIGFFAVDAFASKALAVGAHRATLVSAAGFTKGALAKIRAQYANLIDPVELRHTDQQEWPRFWKVREIYSLGPGEQKQAAQIIHRRYYDPVTDKIRFEILYANLAVDTGFLVTCLLIDPGADGHGLVGAWTLSNAYKVPELTIEYVELDTGASKTVTVMASRHPYYRSEKSVNV